MSLKLQKSVSLTYPLHVHWGNRMILRSIGLFKEFFRAESYLKMRSGYIVHNLMHYSGFRAEFDPKVQLGCIARNLVHYSSLIAQTFIPTGSSRSTLTFFELNLRLGVFYSDVPR